MSLELEDVPRELRPAAEAALAAAGIEDGHLSVELVGEARIHELNREHRDKDEPTDVLSFPLDGSEESVGPRELGDVVICLEHTADAVEATVHGVLHLCGYDHETDDGEMLALQERIMVALPESGPTRSGFVGLAGRPNVGKSTLTNALVGAKVAIVSDRPQTTRRAVRGVATAPDASWQMIFVDLPGVQKPRDVLTERMQRRVERVLRDSDVIAFVINAEQGIGPGDRFIAQTLLAARPECPVICAVNKIDRVKHHELVAVLTAAAEFEIVNEVFPISARRGTGLEELEEKLSDLMPEGPLLYPTGDHSDLPSEVHLAELIREQILRRTRDEIPHAVEVEVSSLATREDGLIDVRADVWAETDSQKAILIGKGGRMVREVGTAARRELERELGQRVYLDLRVRVRARWRRDEDLLDRLGIE